MKSKSSSNSSKEDKGFEGNTKSQIPPAKHWVFTHHNYTEEDITEWKNIAKSSTIEVMVFQTEVCPSTGRKHLQGCLSYHTKGRPKNLHSSKVPHFEKHAGKTKKRPWGATLQEMRNYCVKDEEDKPEPFVRFCYGWNPPEVIRTIVPDRWWQKEILEIISKQPDDRTIHWYWSEAGGIGKTAMLKYLAVHHGAIPCSGKGADMRNAIRDYTVTNGHTPKIIIVPIPRSFSVEYLSFEGIEQVKDMIFYSGKYEGGVVCGNPPHLIVLANVPPDESKMSADRWHVVCID